MSETIRSSTESSWPVALRKRRVLAGYLDYLLFGAPWAVAMWIVADSVPQLHRASFPVKVILFVILEALVLKLIKWSPGQHCLGIVAFQRSPFVSSHDPTSAKPSYFVEPYLFANGRWWTVLFGVLAVLSGAKDLARWTMWHAPLPIMGVELSAQLSVAVQALIGAAEILVGVAVLRLSALALPVGLTVYGFQLVSTVMSWRLMPKWVEAYVHDRRSYQGTVPRPGEIEFMQAVVPAAMVLFAVAAAGWLLLVGRRSRQARAV